MTVKAMKDILANPGTYTETSIDKKFLTNLGSFYGMLTLRNARSVLLIHLEFKEMLQTA
jgi:hypothetical protein